MNAGLLLQNATEYGPLGMLLMAAAGLLVGVAPGSYPLLAAGAGLTSAAHRSAPAGWDWRALYLASGFVLAIATVDAALGGLMAILGFGLLRFLAPLMIPVYFLLGLALAFAGLALLGVVRVDLRLLYARPRPVTGFWSAFTLGIPFGMSTCPACTPLVLPVLIAAMGSSNVIMGAAFLFVFGLARGIPIALTAAASGLLRRLTAMMFWMPSVERIIGAVLLVAALAYAYQGAVWAGWLPPAP